MCFVVMYSNENDTCGVTFSLYPHALTVSDVPLHTVAKLNKKLPESVCFASF